MARKSDIQYVQFYTDGSAARQIAPKPPRRKKPERQVRPQQQKKLVVRVDPVALAGIVVAAVMLVLMAVGIFRLQDAQEEAAAMERYVTSLQGEQDHLQYVYKNGYDLDEVEKMALALGMVPVDEVKRIPIVVTVPQAPPEPTIWESICVFFEELFA